MKLRLFLICTAVAACAPIAPPPSDGPTPAPAPGPVSTPAPTPTPAAPPSSQARPYAEQDFEGWKQGFLARHGGANRAAYERELAGLYPDPTVISRDRNQPEFSRPAGAYITSALSAERISRGQQLIAANPWMSSVESRFGVPKEILVAIWAQESAFGAIQGDMDVIRSLATLAHDGRRGDWAETQLAHALDIVVSGRAPRERLKGSWAGAMGQTQFMPDNYLRLGVDCSNDGRVDIWGSDADALCSAANLLDRANWRDGQRWGYEVTLPSGFDYALAEGEERPWSFWAGRGVRLARGGTPNAAESAEAATILLPQGAAGPAFLALPNHYVIRRYNNSVSYALAIGLLADRMAGRDGLVRAWPDEAPLSRDQRMGAQRALAAAGFDPGGIDGIVGSGTRRALRAWQQANGLIPDGHLTAALADRLMSGR